jgi:hypothetical protein
MNCNISNLVPRTDLFQITLNNLTVGRSVLEALRLLEAFQAVAKHGVLCPVDWKPNGDAQDAAQDTLNTISNTLTESYDERLANLQKEFGDEPITDLDAKHEDDHVNTRTDTDDSEKSTPKPTVQPSSSQPDTQVPTIQEVSCQRPDESSLLHNHHNDCLPHPPSPAHSPHLDSSHSRPSSVQLSDDNTSNPTAQPATAARKITARHARGTATPSSVDARYVHNLFSQPAPSIFQLLRRTSQDSSSNSDTD